MGSAVAKAESFGRDASGRVYRLDAAGNRLSDQLAELQVENRELQMEVATLEDRLSMCRGEDTGREPLVSNGPTSQELQEKANKELATLKADYESKLAALNIQKNGYAEESDSLRSKLRQESSVREEMAKQLGVSPSANWNSLTSEVQRLKQASRESSHLQAKLGDAIDEISVLRRSNKNLMVSLASARKTNVARTATAYRPAPYRPSLANARARYSGSDRGNSAQSMGTRSAPLIKMIGSQRQ